MVKEKRIDGICDIRDESDKDGIRVVFELKRDTNSAVILNNLYKHTALESTFGIINLAIVDKPAEIPQPAGPDRAFRPPPDRSHPETQRVRPQESAKRRVHILDRPSPRARQHRCSHRSDPGVPGPLKLPGSR